MVHGSGDRFPGTEKGIVYGTCPGLPATRGVDTDASNIAIGGVLSQVQNGSERVVAYFSKSLMPETEERLERQMFTSEVEPVPIDDEDLYFHFT